MQDSEYARGACLADDSTRIILCVAGMNDQGQVYFTGESHLRGEGRTLSFAGRVVVVVVESTLTDRHGARPKHGAQPGQVPQRVESRSVVRVDPGRREYEVRVFRGARRSSGTSVKGLADANDRRRARIAGAPDYLVAVAGERRVREVGVAVDEDRRASVLRGHLRSIQRRTGAAT
jgi:hypothetical protein